jgi:glutathione synthase/RimK-type ligase-like ATP-grasp enzyme
LGISNDNLDISIKNEASVLIKPLECDVWHRRGQIFKFKKDPNVFESFLSTECHYLFIGLISILEEECNTTGGHFSPKDNRVFNGYLARKVGLRIPASIITTSKNDLINFGEVHRNVITKPIAEIFRGQVKGLPVVGKVHEINESDLSNISDVFFPMYFQEKIQRSFEVRAFIIKGLIFAIAVFIEDDSNVDYRFSELRNTRQAPYKLPIKDKEKCFDLLSLLDLDSASFDFIVTPDGDHYFLELNPFGSIHRNSFIEYYNLPEKIIELITHYEKTAN